MSKDISQYSDEELMQIAGISAPAQPSQIPQTPETPSFSNEELQRLAQNEPGIYDKILNLTQQLGEGAPLKAAGEFAKELPVGLGRSAIGAVQAGAQFTGQPEFAERIGEQLQRQKEAEGELSLAQRAGRATGETILPALASPARTIVGGIVGGGLAGLTAPQEQPDLGKRLTETATGAAIGGVLGGALEAGRAITGKVRKLFTTATKAEDILAKRLPKGQTADLLEQLKTATPDSPVILPDIAGDEMQGLTRAVGKMANGRDIISEALEGRSKNAVTRVVNRLSKDISDVDNYFGNLDDLTKARSEMAAPLYKKAFDKGTKLDLGKKVDPVYTTLKTIPGKELSSSQVKTREFLKKITPEIKQARSKLLRSPERYDKLPDNHIEILDATKKMLDDKIGVAIRAGEKQQAASLLGLKSELLTRLDKVNPDYAKARKVFSDYSSIQNAQEQGLKFSTLRPEQLQRFMKNLSVSEKEAFRIGVRENLQKTVTSTTEGADPAKRIFGNQFKRDQLKAIFPNQTIYKQFEKRMIEEIKAAETKFRVLGGSRTDINLSDESQFLNIASRIGGGVALGSKFAVINGAISSIRRLSPGITEKNAKTLATILVNKGKSIEALEKIVQKEKNATQQRVMRDFIDKMRLPAVGAGVINPTQE